ITGYKIERSTDGGTTWSTIVSSTGSTATTYSDTGLAASTAYAYRVSAINSVGTSSPSNIASATTFSSSIAPSAPQNLQATPGNSQVSLSWQTPSSNGGSAITSYTINRGPTSGAEATIASVSGSTLSYTDTTSSNGITYYYTVTATNSVGDSPSSNEVSATPQQTIIYMQDTTASFGLSVYSGRQIQSEYVTSSSALVGKQIDTILVQLKKGGLPTGTVTVGVFNSDLSVKQAFGTADVSTLTTSYKSYTFAMTAPNTYQIQSGDRIGIKYTGGDSSNYAAIMTDQTNSFDGTNSYLMYYTTSWQSFTGVDLTMTLEQ
ncbi:MAG: fibronectin type III domain-containing protein, partial [Thaumarchaeota archaeon]